MQTIHPQGPTRRFLLAGIGAGVVGLIALAVLSYAIGSGPNLLSAIGRPVLFAAVGALALGGRPLMRGILVIWAGLKFWKNRTPLFKLSDLVFKIVDSHAQLRILGDPVLLLGVLNGSS